MSKNLKMCTLLDCYGKLLSDNQRVFAECYYNEDLSLAEIAENEGITKQGVRDSIKRAEAQLEEVEHKLGIVRKSKALKELARTCRQDATENNFAKLFDAIDNL